MLFHPVSTKDKVWTCFTTWYQYSYLCSPIKDQLLADFLNLSFSPHVVPQAPSPSLPWLLWPTTSAAGTTMTRKTCRQWMRALTSMTSPMTLSGSTSSTRMASATSPGIHTSLPHQRKCCRAFWTRNARYRWQIIQPHCTSRQRFIFFPEVLECLSCCFPFHLKSETWKLKSQ